jgi:DNA adenine methylase
MTNKSETQLTPPLKWHGGKSYLADWIIDLMPKHLHYVEPFGGGLAVLLAKDPFDQRHQWSEKPFEKGISEVVNDVNRELMNFWKVLQDEESFRRFQRIVEATPFAQPQWDDAGMHMLPRHKLDIEAAVAFFVRCRQSRAGGFKVFATLSRNRTRRGMNEQVSAWLGCIEGLAEIQQCHGRVMLSGYPNELYDRTLHDWNRHDREIDNKVSGGASKRVMTESLWCNF